VWNSCQRAGSWHPRILQRLALLAMSPKLESGIVIVGLN
jgi:hypothetical protein